MRRGLAPGVTPLDGGVEVAVWSAGASRLEFCLFDAAGASELSRVDLAPGPGDVWSAFVPGVAIGARYGLRAHGLYDPSRGARFNPAKLLLDPFARAIDRPFALAASMFGHRGDGEGPDERDSAADMPKAIVVASEPPAPRWRGADRPQVVYELHARGFTKLHPDIPEAIRGTFAGLAHPAALAHLTRLGVTTVEIMPAAAWIDERHLGPLGLSNYWGYNPVALCAPDPRLAPGGWAEVREAIAALHAAGLEVLLDVVLNHTGEGDALGPTLSLRGLDNSGYYRLRPDDPSAHIDDSGCGNCLALDRGPGLRLAMEALRVWAAAGFDGFRFDLATALGRRETGFDPHSPLLAAIAQDPALSGLRLVAEPWDIGPGGYQAGAFPPTWSEWNDRFRDDVRRFWRGDRGMAGAMATRLAGSADMFGGRRNRPSRSLNFIAAHDGFTLTDLVSHTRKHNAANGEDDRDGVNDNASWNNGVEGESDDPAVLAARRRDALCLLAALLLSRGVPMLSMGDELGRGQRGNNNAYAQDNALSWIDWSRADEGLIAATSALIAFRAAHPAVHDDAFLCDAIRDETGLRDVEWYRPDGVAMASADWDGAGALVAAFYTPRTGERAADRVFIAFNPGREGLRVALPAPREGRRWLRRFDAGRPDAEAEPVVTDMPLEARSAVILAEAVDADSSGLRRPADAAAIDRLAAAAGIAGEWWDIAGARHETSRATKQALLVAMGLPCALASEAAASLAKLAAAAPLPRLVLARPDEPILLPLVFEALAPLEVECEALREDGARQAFRLPVRVEGEGCRIELPPQPVGYHSLRLADRPDREARLIVAPGRCFLPPALGPGARLTGLSVQLYGLRRPGDQGVGDFTALRLIGEAAARAGFAAIGLNPLHALFPEDRGRASPYHPSDRRFLDPIYVDVAAVEEVAASEVFAALAPEFAAPRASATINYSVVWRLKRRCLADGFRRFPGSGDAAGPRAADHQAFVAAGGEALARFALEEAARDPEGGEPAFVVWLQWIADRQFAAAGDAARAAGLTLGFCRDLAVGGAPDGSEARAERARLMRGVSIGAPPDPFSPLGQVWSLPPPDPHAVLADGCAAFAALARANMREAGALRVDHVMGLRRLFCVPDGMAGADGAYVTQPLEALLAALALESWRARAIVIGEDLGTVPEGFRERLADADILGTRVLWFERDGAGLRPPESWPDLALACVSTHDLPTLAGWWEGADLAERAALGLLEGAALEAARAGRAAEKRLLGAAVGFSTSAAAPLPDAAAAAVHAYVAASPCRLVMVQIEDLVGEVVGVNLPGTDRERPNWRRRLPVDVETLFETSRARAILSALREAGRLGAAPEAAILAQASA